MIIGVPKEVKNHEYRVGLTPPSVRELVHKGHEVVVQTTAGDGIGCADRDYESHGAKIVSSAEQVYDTADMIIKVKEPQPQECKMLRPGQVLFTYLHLAADKEQTQALLDSGCIAIAYETVTSPTGSLPLLTPMSEVAGRMSIQAGAHCLQKGQGGKGVLLGGVPGIPPGKVVIIGGGVVGMNAARIAVGMGAEVTIIDKSLARLAELDNLFTGRLKTLYANLENIEESVIYADLVVGAVLVPGAAAPKLVSENQVKAMHAGAVLVDVAIDQGGCFETSRPTSHEHPSYIEHGIVHYCVTNMPGAAARTSTYALNNATLPYAMALANKGYKQALTDDPYLLQGLNIYKGHVTYEAVARDLDYEYMPAKQALETKSAA